MNSFEKLAARYGKGVATLIVENKIIFTPEETKLLLSGATFSEVDDPIDLNDYGDETVEPYASFRMNPMAHRYRPMVGLSMWPRHEATPGRILNALTCRADFNFTGSDFFNNQMPTVEIVTPFNQKAYSQQINSDVVIVIGTDLTCDSIEAKVLVAYESSIDANEIEVTHHLNIFGPVLAARELRTTDQSAIIAVDRMRITEMEAPESALFVNPKSTNPSSWGHEEVLRRYYQYLDCHDSVSDQILNKTTGELLTSNLAYICRNYLVDMPRINVDLTHGLYKQPKPAAQTQSTTSTTDAKEAVKMEVVPLTEDEICALKQLHNSELCEILAAFDADNKGEDGVGKNERVRSVLMLCKVPQISALVTQKVREVLRARGLI